MHLIISRDFRKPECSGYGENSKITYLRINMLAERNDRDYCGVFRSQVGTCRRTPKYEIQTQRKNFLESFFAGSAFTFT